MSSEPITLTSFLPKIHIPLVSLHKYLLEKLDKYSDQYLIECETNSFYTFHQLANDSRRAANIWLDLGLKEGDIFGVVGQNCYQYLTLYLGGIIAGGIASGLRTNDTFQEVVNKIIQRNIKYLAISGSNIAFAKKISEGIPITEKILLFNGGNKLNDKINLYSELIETYEPISDDMMSLPNDTKESVCLITETSGSTGPSKAVQFTHYSVVSALEITSLPMIFGYTLNDVISCHSQFSHQSAIFQVFTGIATGSKIAIMPQLNYNQFINYVQKYLITAALLPPPVIIRLAKDPEDRDISSLTKIISFGSVLHKNIGNQFTSRYKHVKDLRQGLFHTECMAPISLMVKNSTEFDSIGVPTPNTKVKIINPETGEQLSANQNGIICVHREDALSKGYLNNSKTLINSDGWLRTRDLGFYDEDGMLYFVENIDLMIRCSGLLISPSELEGLLLSHSNVCEAAVIGMPDANEEQIPTAFVVLNPSVVGKISGYDIEQFVNDQLPKKKRIRSVNVMNSLPKNIFGKIIKRQLRDDLLFKISKRKF